MKKIKGKENSLEYCPTQSGSFTGYVAEYLKGEIWERIPTTQFFFPNAIGIPYPRDFGGILSTIYLFGYEQAQAIAWLYASREVSQWGRKKPQVRVQAYEILYDIKAQIGRAHV